MARWSATYARFVTAHPRSVLLVALVLGLCGAALVSSLHFETSYVALVPDDVPELDDRDDIVDQVPAGAELILSVRGPAHARLAFAHAVVNTLRDSPAVFSADFVLPTEFFETRWMHMVSTERLIALDDALKESLVRTSPLYVELDDDVDPWADVTQAVDAIDQSMGPIGTWRERQHADHGSSHDPDAPDVLTSEDGTALLVAIQPARVEELAQGDDALTTIETAIADADPASYGVQTQLAGAMVVAREEQQVLSIDMVEATLLALLLVIVAMVVTTRRASTLVVMTLPLVLALAVTLGVTSLWLGQLNLVSGFMVPALVGLGIDFCIHLHLRYLEALNEDPNPRTAMRLAVEDMLIPCGASALTTAAAFAALTLSDFKGISEYGEVAALGILTTLVMTFLTLPPLAQMMVTRPRLKTTPSRSRGVLARPRAAAVVGVGVVVVIVAGWLTSSLSFKNDFRELRGQSDADETYREVTEAVGQPFDPSILMVNHVDDARTVIDLIEQRKTVQASDDTIDVGFSHALSMAQLLPRPMTEARDEALEGLRKTIRRLNRKRATLDPDAIAQLDALTRAAAAEPWSMDGVPAPLRQRLVARDGEHQFILLWNEDLLSTDQQLIDWSAEFAALSDAAHQAGTPLWILDDGRVTARMIKIIRADAPVMLLLAAALVLLLIVVTFRNTTKVLLVGGVLSAGVATTTGVMVLLGVDINLFNAVVLPSIVGIGIDNAIHIQHGYDTMGHGSIMDVWRTRGRAALLSSATTGIGFGAMIIAHHYGIRTLGMTAIMGVVATFIYTTLVLGCLLRLLESSSHVQTRQFTTPSGDRGQTPRDVPRAA